MLIILFCYEWSPETRSDRTSSRFLYVILFKGPLRILVHRRIQNGEGAE